MVRISKQADYGIVLLSHFARKAPGISSTARELAAESGLPLPTVGKILKGLARAGILESRRGVKGGYRLTRSARDVTVASIIEALEGPIAVVDCSPSTRRICGHEPRCPVKGPLQRVDAAVRKTLETVTLGELVVAG